MDRLIAPRRARPAALPSAHPGSADQHDNNAIARAPSPVLRAAQPSADGINHFGNLPFELQAHIFSQIGDHKDPYTFATTGLTGFAKTSRNNQANVRAFLRDVHEGRKIARDLRTTQHDTWAATHQTLRENAQPLRVAFAETIDIASTMLASDAPPEHIAEALSAFKGCHIIAGDYPEGGYLSLLLGALHSPVVKISARGLGHNFILDALLPALSHVNPECALVLDLSGNGLRGEDLHALARQMRARPAVFQLNLADNPLCSGEGCSHGVVDLLSALGPVTHLNLSKTQMNDATAVASKPFIVAAPFLRVLDLRDNALHHEGLFAVIDTVGEMLAPQSDDPAPVARRHLSLMGVLLNDCPDSGDVDSKAYADNANRIANYLTSGIASDGPLIYPIVSTCTSREFDNWL